MLTVAVARFSRIGERFIILILFKLLICFLKSKVVFYDR